MLISDNLGTVKVVGVVLITALGAFGAATPVLASKLGRRNARIAHYLGFIQQLLLALGTGVIIATALVHIIPEGIDSLEEGGISGSEEVATLPMSTTVAPPGAVPAPTTVEAEEEHEGEHEAYPYGFLFATCGLVATFIIESELHRVIDRTSEGAIKAHILEVSVAVHSIVIGIAFGALADAKSANTLALALTFHQLCEGFAVGPVFMGGATNTIHLVAMLLIFIFSTPFGVGIGTLIFHYGDPASSTYHLTQGVLECVAGGVLLYVGCVEFLGHLMNDDIEHQTARMKREQKLHEHCHEHHEHEPTGEGAGGEATATAIDDVVKKPMTEADTTTTSEPPCAPTTVAATDRCTHPTYMDTWGNKEGPPTSAATPQEPNGDAAAAAASQMTTVPINGTTTAAAAASRDAADDCPVATVTSGDVGAIDKDLLSKYTWLGRILTYLMVIAGAAAMAVVAKWA